MAVSGAAIPTPLQRRPLLAVMQDSQNIHIGFRCDPVDDDVGESRNRKLAGVFQAALAAKKRKIFEHLRGLTDARNHAPGGGLIKLGDVVVNLVKVGQCFGCEVNVQGRTAPRPWKQESCWSGLRSAQALS